MKTVKSNEFVFLRLPPIEDNISFIYQTFGIMQYIFYDDRFPTKNLKDIHTDKFNKEYYEKFREKCLKIKNKKEISFTINEFIFFAKIIDFVSKCFIGKPNEKLKLVLNADFDENKKFDYDFSVEWYLNRATKLFNDFKNSCPNKDIVKKIEHELNWEIEN